MFEKQASIRVFRACPSLKLDYTKNKLKLISAVMDKKATIIDVMIIYLLKVLQKYQ